MYFNPQESWKCLCVLSGGGTIHHASPAVMRMRLPNGELATADAENASVFGRHFHRIFNNHIPIYWPVLEKIKQIEVMDELYEAITTKLANNKAPGLNGVPPNAFKALDDANLS